MPTSGWHAVPGDRIVAERRIARNPAARVELAVDDAHARLSSDAARTPHAATSERRNQGIRGRESSAAAVEATFDLLGGCDGTRRATVRRRDGRADARSAHHRERAGESGADRAIAEHDRRFPPHPENGRGGDEHVRGPMLGGGPHRPEADVAREDDVGTRRPPALPRCHVTAQAESDAQLSATGDEHG